MSADAGDDLYTSLQQLAARTSAAAGTLRQRVTLADVTPRPACISLAPQRAPAASTPPPATHVTPAPASAPRLSLNGSANGRPSPTPTPGPTPAAAAPRWAQDGRDTRVRASTTLAPRVPTALAAMAAVTSAPGSTIVHRLPMRPARTPSPQPVAPRPSPQPVAPPSRPRTALAVRGRAVRPARATRAGAVSYAGSLILLAVAMTKAGDAAQAAAFGGLGALLLGHVLRFVWLHRVWRVLPAASLVDSSGAPVTPAGAVGRHFIPFYNLYWMFAARAIVCRALAAAAASAGVSRDPPRVTGALAGVVGMIPYANLLLGPLFDLVFMARVDGIIERVRRAQGQTP